MKKTFFICVKVLDRTAVQKLKGIGNKAYPFALCTLTSQRFRKLVRCAFCVFTRTNIFARSDMASNISQAVLSE